MHAARRWGLLALLLLLGSCAVHGPETSFARAHRERVLAPAAEPISGTTVQWFGVSTLLFRDGKDAILIDGFLSRPSLAQTVFGRLAPSREAAIEAVAEARVGKIAAIFVAHAHHDHVLDAPAVAALHGATLHGSASALNVAHHERMKSDFPVQPVIDRHRYEAAGFTVQAFKTAHADTLFSLAAIEAPLAFPAHALAFRAGTNYSFLVQRKGLRILVVPSAMLEPGDIEADADIVFLGIGGLGKESAHDICSLWENAVRQRKARQVILVHWDNFFYAPGPVLRTFGRPLDDVPRSVALLSRLAEQDDIALNFVQPHETVGLHARSQREDALAARPHRCCHAWARAHGNI